MSKLAPDEVRAVLARAAEIQSLSSSSGTDVEAILEAAEEVGIARSAVESALRERMNFSLTPPAVGDLIFAKSADEKFYVAEVLAPTAEGVRVRFLRGGEHTVSFDELQPCSFLPGAQVVVQWPWWGPWTCTVVSYDADKRQVMVTDNWAETRIFPIDKVWLNSPRKHSTDSQKRARIYARLIGAGAAAGALIGSIITALVTR